MTRVPAACDAKRACEYLGCTKNRLDTLVSNGTLSRLGPNWYAYADLDECVEKIRRERTAGTGKAKEKVTPTPTLTVETSEGATPQRYTAKTPRELVKAQAGS